MSKQHDDLFKEMAELLVEIDESIDFKYAGRVELGRRVEKIAAKLHTLGYL